MPDDLSTSAQLRQCQRNLAASQADLTRAEVELTKTRIVNEALLAAAERVEKDRDLARSELASARIELERLRAISASCHVTNCALCGRSIRCDEPREPTSGASGYFQHAGGCVPQTETVRHSVQQSATDSPPNT